MLISLATASLSGFLSFSSDFFWGLDRQLAIVSFQRRRKRQKKKNQSDWCMKLVGTKVQKSNGGGQDRGGRLLGLKIKSFSCLKMYEDG